MNYDCSTKAGIADNFLVHTLRFYNRINTGGVAMRCLFAAAFVVITLFTAKDYGVTAGLVKSWGEMATPNAKLIDVIAISGGESHNLALRENGSIVGWGRNDYGQAGAPAGWNYAAIAAGDYHSLAIVLPCQYILTGNLNADCRVDLEDLDIFTGQWLTAGGSAELDNVGGVTMSDFALLAESWRVDCETNPSNPACVHK
jgi:hypothetical protein